MGSGANGANHFFRFRGGKNKLHVSWWLFNNLQKRIEALGSDHVGFIQNKDFVAISCGSKDRSFSQVPGVINTVVRRGVDFDYIQ